MTMAQTNWLPNLIIPGAGKSGTSSLHSMLAQHPDVYMCSPKEPQFFSNDDIFARGLGWYSGLFNAGNDRTIRGESSTTYLCFPNVIERMLRTLKEVRFIVLLRNPIDRAWSHYRWAKSLGVEKRPFRAAFLADTGSVPDYSLHSRGAYLYYFEEGRYGHHVARFIRAFGRERIHVVTSEALVSTPVEVLNGCTAFLGLHEPSTWTIISENVTVPSGLAGIDAFVRGAPLNSAIAMRLRASLRPVLGQVGRRVGESRYYRGGLSWTSRRLRTHLRIEDRRWLAHYYAEDVAHLRKVVGSTFEDWSGDFP